MGCGPVQILVIGFSDDSFAAEVLPELRRLREHDLIRVIDLHFVSKDDAGNLTRIDVAALTADEYERFGVLIAALIGSGPFGAEGISIGAGAGVGGSFAAAPTSETWAISDAIPPGLSAAVVLIEHGWAIPLRAAISRAGGFALEDTWVLPADLAAVGAAGARTGWRWDGGQDAS